MDSDIARILPAALPLDWRMLIPCRDGAAYIRRDGLIVVVNQVLEEGDRWLHVSCSKGGAILTIGDLQAVKTAFMGESRVAFQILPPACGAPELLKCLHLWTSLDGRAFPAVLKKR